MFLSKYIQKKINEETLTSTLKTCYWLHLFYLVSYLSKLSVNPLLGTDAIKSKYVNLKFRYMQNRLHIKVEIEHQIDGRTSVNSTAVQALFRRLHKRWFGCCTRVESIIIQLSNRLLDNCQLSNCNCKIDDHIDCL